MKRRKWRQVCSVLIALCLMGSVLWEPGLSVKAQESQENADEPVSGNGQEAPGSGGKVSGEESAEPDDVPKAGVLVPQETEPETVITGEKETETGAATPKEEPGTGAVAPDEKEQGTGTATREEKEPGTGAAMPEEPGTGAAMPEEPGTGAAMPEEPGTGAAMPEEPGTGAATSEGDTLEQRSGEAGVQQADIFNQDFEDTAEGALPRGWKFGNPGNSKASAGVKAIGGNHVLVLDQSEDNSNANYNPGLSYTLPDSYKKVVFSYSIAAKSPGGVLYLPSVEGVADGSTKRFVESYMIIQGRRQRIPCSSTAAR